MPGPPSGPGQVPDTNGFQRSLNLFKWFSSGRSLRRGVGSSPVKRPGDCWAVKLPNRVGRPAEKRGWQFWEKLWKSVRKFTHKDHLQLSRIWLKSLQSMKQCSKWVTNIIKTQLSVHHLFKGNLRSRKICSKRKVKSKDGEL